jgi:tyrosinase
MELNRRQLIGGGAALAAAMVRPTFAFANGRVRPAVHTTLNPASIATYKKAVAEMLKLDPSDGRNWFRQVLIHIVDCPHGNWWFLPWHRGYLANFESICAQMAGDPNFALPYWDWTAGPSVPAVFFDPELDPGTQAFVEGYEKFRQQGDAVLSAWWATLTPSQKEQLATGGLNSVSDVLTRMDLHFDYSNGARSKTAAAPNLDSETVAVTKLEYVREALGPEAYAGFASAKTANHYEGAFGDPLESGPHDNVHGDTGGFMGAFLSPTDPLFWLHHANLDRLWDVWTRKQKKIGKPVEPDSADLSVLMNEKFEFFYDAAGTALSKTCADYFDLTPLGYSYEPGAGEAIVDDAKPSPMLLVNSFSASGLDLDLRNGFETSVALTGLSPALSQIAPGQSGNLYARIALTPPTNKANARIKVFMNCPYLSRFTPVDDPHYVGTISFFAALHGGGHQHHASDYTVTLPLGVALSALGLDGNLPKNAIKIQLITESGETSRAPDGLLKSVTIFSA